MLELQVFKTLKVIFSKLSDYVMSNFFFFFCSLQWCKNDLGWLKVVLGSAVMLCDSRNVPFIVVTRVTSGN